MEQGGMMFDLNLGGTLSEKKELYEIVIIGGGPAGLTAGIYGSRSKRDTLIIEKLLPGGQVGLTDLVENYPGFPEGINGPDLVKRMEEQAKRFGAEILTDEIIDISLAGDIKEIVGRSNVYKAKTVIIASGAEPRKLGVPGEKEFTGKGVSYCATCDGAFFEGQEIAVVGGGDTAVQEAIYLTQFAKKVTIIHRRDKLRASKILQERAFKNDKIEFLWDSVVTEIIGDKRVEKIKVKNVKTQEESIIEKSGIFIYIGLVPNTDYLKGKIKLSEDGYIITDENMKTDIEGVYAAGDIRKKNLRQIVTAVADGAQAAMSAVEYLEEKE